MTVIAIDADGDGFVDEGEFIAAGGTAEDFALLDIDGNGKITQEEFDANEALPEESAPQPIDLVRKPSGFKGWSMSTIIEDSVQQVVDARNEGARVQRPSSVMSAGS